MFIFLRMLFKFFFNKWNQESVVDERPLDWDKYKVCFIDRSFPINIREEKLL